MGNRLPLNGRGLFKPHGFQSVFDVWVQVQGVKSNPLLGDGFVPLLVGIHVTKVGQRPRATFRQTLLFMGWACIFDSSLPCRCHDSLHAVEPLLPTPLGLLLCRFSTWARATHLVGGEMTYTHLGNNQSNALTVHGDCGPTNTLGTGSTTICTWGCGTARSNPTQQSRDDTCRKQRQQRPCGAWQSVAPHPRNAHREGDLHHRRPLPPTTYGWT